VEESEVVLSSAAVATSEDELTSDEPRPPSLAATGAVIATPLKSSSAARLARNRFDLFIVVIF
jgi:hypothetical protein